MNESDVFPLEQQQKNGWLEFVQILNVYNLLNGSKVIFVIVRVMLVDVPIFTRI